MIYAEYTELVRTRSAAEAYVDGKFDGAIYRNIHAETDTLFRAALEEEYLTELDASAEQKNILWDKAYADGHSIGYSEIENYYIDLVSFLEEYLGA